MPHITTDDGVRISYRLDGEAGRPTLLLSNSLGTALGMWDAQMPAFAGRFQVLRYDSRGHGGSDVPPGPYSIERLGHDALSLLDRLGIDQVLFCGLSKGGMVGQWLGVHAPDRVTRLVLCNTSARIGTPEVWKQRIAAVEAEGMAAIAPGVIDRWFTKPFQTREPATVARIRELMLATDPKGYIACAAAVRDMDQVEAIRAIRAPVLVVAGRYDEATPPDHARLIAERIPGAQLVELDAAHLSNIEAEPAFTAAVLEFLSA